MEAFKGLKSHVATDGSLILDDYPVITLRKNNESFIIKPASGDLPQEWLRHNYDKQERRLSQQVDDIRGLTNQMPQAAFGHGKETKHDAAVRNALQLNADEFTTNIPSCILNQITESIKHNLSLQTDIALEPYSLNVYQEGGHFITHKDTPRGEDMLGSLVICLPSLFKGGMLDVITEFETKSYFGFSSTVGWFGNWTEWARKHGDDKKILWSAFFQMWTTRSGKLWVAFE